MTKRQKWNDGSVVVKVEVKEDDLTGHPVSTDEDGWRFFVLFVYTPEQLNRHFNKSPSRVSPQGHIFNQVSVATPSQVVK